MQYIKKINLPLIIEYTKAKLEAESERTFLGYFWWILDPLIGVGIYYLLFKVFLNRGGDDYIPFLFIGLITWKWFTNSITKGTASIHGAAGIFKKVYVQKIVFPTVDIFYQSWKFLLVFVFTCVVYAVFGYCRSLNVLYIPVILIAEFIVLYGIGVFISAITPYLPDLKFVVGYIMKLMFYPSGILFDLARVPEKYQIIIKINFMSGIVQSYRNVIMYDKPPVWFAIIYATIVGLIFFTVGYIIIIKKDKIYPKIC